MVTGGLAEPKFNIDGTAFTGPWGRFVLLFIASLHSKIGLFNPTYSCRPQRGNALLLEVKLFGAEVLTTILPDGPALRATALITYANWLVANSNKTFVTTTLWPIIKLDLDYVMNLWNQTT